VLRQPPLDILQLGRHVGARDPMTARRASAGGGAADFNGTPGGIAVRELYAGGLEHGTDVQGSAASRETLPRPCRPCCQ